MTPEIQTENPSLATTTLFDVKGGVPVKRVLLGAKKGLFNGQSVVVMGIDSAGELRVWGSDEKASDTLVLIERGKDYLQHALTQ